MEGEERREEEEEEIQAVRKLYRLTKSHVIIDDATDGQTDSAEKDVRFFVWPVLFEAVDNIPYLKASLRYSGLFVKLIPEPPTIPSHRWRSPNRIFHLPFMKATLAALPIGRTASERWEQVAPFDDGARTSAIANRQAA